VVDVCRIGDSLRLDATDPGTRAGLVVLGENYAYIGLTRDAEGSRVEARTYTPGQSKTVHFSAPVPGPVTPVQLRVSSTDEGLCTFRFRTTPDGEWTTALDGFQALPALWTSAELGLFATAPPGTPGTGQAFFGAVGSRCPDRCALVSAHCARGGLSSGRTSVVPVGRRRGPADEGAS